MTHYRSNASSSFLGLSNPKEDNLTNSYPFSSQTGTPGNTSANWKEKVDTDLILEESTDIEDIDNTINNIDNNNGLSGNLSPLQTMKSRPVVIFGMIDLSRHSSFLQYVILSTGLLIFMCLYGYYQELVAYNYFNRRLSIFSTFLHFLGCFLVAHFQRKTVQRTKFIGNVLTMGTAPWKVGVMYYIFLITLKTVSQGLTNVAMTQINYPCKGELL